MGLAHKEDWGRGGERKANMNTRARKEELEGKGEKVGGERDHEGGHFKNMEKERRMQVREVKGGTN